MCLKIINLEKHIFVLQSIRRWGVMRCLYWYLYLYMYTYMYLYLFSNKNPYLFLYSDL